MLNLFNAWRVLLKSGTARVTLRLPNRETARFFSTISAPRPATALDRIAQVVGDDRVVAVADYANLQTYHRVACDLQAPSAMLLNAPHACRVSRWRERRPG